MTQQLLQMNQAQNQQQMVGGPIDINGNVIKAEQMKYYDPMYGYYSMGMPAQNQSENKQSAQLSLSTSTMPAMWDLHNAQMQQLPPMPPKQEVNGNSDGVLVPKQEPIYDEQMQQYLNQTAAAAATASSYDPLQAMPDFMNTMNTMNSMMPYYPPPNMNYLNYENQHLLYSGNHNQMLQDPNNMNHQIEKKIEVPPLPPQLMDNEEEALYEINK